MMKTIPSITLLLSLAFAPLSAADVFSGGHGDIGVGLEDGTDFHLHPHLHGGAIVNGSALPGDTEYEAGDLIIRVPQSTEIVVGADIDAAGVEAGESLWVLPQSNPGTNTIPFLGLSTDHLNSADWSTDITFSLVGVISPSGNGTFSLWQSDGLGSLDFYFSSAGAGLTVDNNSLLLAAGVHDHYNWGFSETGTWQVELTASGTHNTLSDMSDTQTFTFNVVPEPSTVGVILGAVVLLAAFVKRRLA